ncbi:phenylalanine ammonia-lyase [Exidia glandulosa HHB12029]|uniref:Phenylalanine ammonia-lyase n=1 Tax=Exidia glandulosa HHB12029 TaxID=1314781 RepID=A0A166A6J9_EXIGL|nr:phenylalanine ammonia-lyase [Exidia glandulosa HHB12029]
MLLRDLDSSGSGGTMPFDMHTDGVTNGATPTAIAPPPYAGLLKVFLNSERELKLFQSGTAPVLDGKSLSVPAVVAAARYGVQVALDDAPEVQARVAASRKVIDEKLASATSIYGVSTGFGGSADTRTDQYHTLGAALLQHHHSGVLSVENGSGFANDKLPLPQGDPLATTSMPVAWVRGAIAVRINSVIRGHSGVRWVVMEQMRELLNRRLTPVVPLRGSISASGDLTPLAYVAGAVTKHPHIRVHTPTGDIIRASETDLPPVALQPKEQLGLMNGTAFSAAVGALATHDALHMALLSQVCTALGTEALLGTQASHVPFIHDICRPHPGQVESARIIHSLLDGSKLASTGTEEEVSIVQDAGQLRQDRYPLRTAAQYLGPQIEDILAAHASVSLECNSTTDNPLIDGARGHIHHGGNFQAMAVTNAMEKTRLALFHIGKIIFAQSTELLNPAFNRGLPPSVAASDPSTNYHAKGLDIATAAYVSELGFLANPVGTHVQSAEMHNQAVNSLALISARATMTALDVLSMLFATYIYVLCQAVDMRAMHDDFERSIPSTLASLLSTHFAADASSLSDTFQRSIVQEMQNVLEHNSTQDAADRMAGAARSAALPLYNTLPARAADVPKFVESLGAELLSTYERLREEYLEGKKTAAPFLGGTRALYEFVRGELGVKIHGLSNLRGFVGDGLDAYGERGVGENVSVIYESIRNGRVQRVLAGMFAQ